MKPNPSIPSFFILLLLFSGIGEPLSAAPDARYKTGYAYDDRCTTYYQNSSEVPQRVAWINKRLQDQGLIEKTVKIDPVSDPLNWVKKIHTQAHIDGIKSIPIDTANGATQSVGEIADLAAAYVMGAVRDVCEGKVDNAFAAIRPPGHHVCNDGTLVGFCAYANAVIAARYARENYNVKKILFVDWDYHYGNGTEFFILNDTNSFLLEFGYSDDSSSQGNANAVHIVTKNVGNGTNAEFEAVLENYLVQKMKTFSPELIIVSCGFDLKKNDDLGSYSVTAHGISRLTKVLMRIADEQCKGKIVSILEGGYKDRESSGTFHGLSQCAENHVRTLMSGDLQPETPYFINSGIRPVMHGTKTGSFSIGNATLSCHSASAVPLNVTLYTVAGRKLFHTTIKTVPATIHLGQTLACGAYLVRISDMKNEPLSPPLLIVTK